MPDRGKSVIVFPARVPDGGSFHGLALGCPVPVWALIAAGTAMIGLGGLFVRGFGDDGFRLASHLAWRATILIYVVAIMASPAGRLIPSGRVKALYRWRHQLLWGFCASFGVFLATILIPNIFTLFGPGRGGLTPGMLLFLVFGAGLTSVTACAADPRLALRIGEPVRRALLVVGLSYFWLAYVLSALSRLSDPGRPDGFYGLSVGLLVAALLLLLADRALGKLGVRQKT
ncbi:MAG: hypothetical protein ACREFW_06195 [Rhizomicrobium sp.]